MGPIKEAVGDHSTIKPRMSFFAIRDENGNIVAWKTYSVRAAAVAGVVALGYITTIFLNS
jgi:hypothetical protein